MPKSLTIEHHNLPAVVQGWLRAVRLDEEETIELIFTEHEVLLRRPMSPEMRDWANNMGDQYDKAFREIVGI